MKFKTFIIIYLLIQLSAIAQFAFPPNSARGRAMGGCYIALNDYWSNINNIAGSASINNWGLGIAFQQNYIMSGNAFKAISFTIPINSKSTILTSYHHYGNKTYNEQQIEIGYAMYITPKITIGATFHYLHSDVNDNYYDPINTLTFALGLQFYPTNKITIGTKIFNPIFIKLSTQNTTYIPTIINIGIAYKFLNNLLGTLEFEKGLHNPIISKIGFEYSITQYIFARIGVSTHPNLFSFGLGIKQSHYAIDITAQTHPNLGILPSISAHYLF